MHANEFMNGITIAPVFGFLAFDLEEAVEAESTVGHHQACPPLQKIDSY
jgi:hypothetical protein